MTNKIELVNIIPTEQEIVNYGKYISTLNLGGDNEEDYEKPYTITDEELTQEKLNEYNVYCEENGIDCDYLLASLITAKCFETTKGGGND